MTPLDLSIAPPRPPREELAGIIFLPRTIDKLRASLDGGNMGLYQLAGFSEWQCAAFNIDMAELREIVENASTDEDVALYVTAKVTPAQIEAWNARARAQRVQGGDREKAVANYPYLAERDEIPLALDNLVEDDARLFA
jgi:hypothetical protein